MVYVVITSTRSGRLRIVADASGRRAFARLDPALRLNKKVRGNVHQFANYVAAEGFVAQRNQSLEGSKT